MELLKSIKYPMFEVPALNGVVDEWIERMDISGNNLGCFLNSFLNEYLLIENKTL